MAQPGEARHVPDLPVARIVVVGVELALVEEPAARGAAIVIGAAAVHRHHLAGEARRGIEARPAPLAARWAALEPAGHAFWSCARQPRHLVGTGRMPALGQVSDRVAVPR